MQFRWKLKNFEASDLFLTGCGFQMLLLPSPNPYMDIFKGKKNYRSTYSEEEFDALAEHYGLDKDDFLKLEVSEDIEDFERDIWSRTEFVLLGGKTCMIQRGKQDEDIGSEESHSESCRRTQN